MMDRPLSRRALLALWLGAVVLDAGLVWWLIAQAGR